MVGGFVGVASAKADAVRWRSLRSASQLGGNGNEVCEGDAA
jgi:hypothetical protein